MRRLIKWWAIGFSMLFFAPYSSGDDQKPLWRIDLRAFGYEPQAWGDTVIRFSGPLLLVYSTYSYWSPMELRLAFDKETRQLVSKERLSAISVPPWKDCQRTEGRRPFPAVNTIDCWKQMTIEQIARITHKGPDETEYYLREPGKEPILLFQGRCNDRDPHFVSDDYVLLTLCDLKNIVVNKQGQKVYDLPKLSDPYITLNREGTRFAAYERDSSFFSELEGTTNRLRVKVFRSSDGEKLFEYHWRPKYDRTNDGRVALSDDGSLVALVQAGDILIFALRPTK
jgi:hypothetical protein